MTKDELNAVCWAALECVAKKECRRDAMVAGSEYDATLRVSGEVNTKAFAAKAEAHLVVNPDGTRLKSQEPPIPQLIAYLLSILSRPKREALLKELPESFAAADNRLPEVDAGLVEAAENLLGRLRSKVQQHVRGSISTSYIAHNLTP